MVTSRDVVIALSNSGETDEIIAILSVFEANRSQSSLQWWAGRIPASPAQATWFSMFRLNERPALWGLLRPRALPHAALGDALALTAMEARKFTKEDYALFHPGGTLGRRLTLRVSDIMRKDEQLALVKPDDKVRDVLFAVTNAAAGAAIVVRPGREAFGA